MSEDRYPDDAGLDNVGKAVRRHKKRANPPVPPPADAAPREEAVLSEARQVLDHILKMWPGDDLTHRITLRLTRGVWYKILGEALRATPPGGDGGTSPEALREAAAYRVLVEAIEAHTRSGIGEMACLDAANAYRLAARAPTGSGPDATWLAVERVWCQALIPEGAEVIQRVTERVLALRSGPPSGQEEG